MKDILKQFTGYDELAQEQAFSRKYGLPLSAAVESARQYIDRLHPTRINLRVQDVIDESPSTRTLRLVSPEGYLPPFISGQYIALIVDVGGVVTTRPYSISSPPNQTGYYDLTVRRVEGGLVSNWLLDSVKPGDKLVSTGPAGQFWPNPLIHDNTLVCLAGGSGVTPFMSMIREAIQCGLDKTFYLFYGNKSLDDAPFHDELTALAARFGNIHYHPVLENPPAGWDGLTGFMTGDLVGKVIGDAKDKTFFLCGPQAMYDFCLPQLADLGAPKRKVRREVYGPPADVTKCEGWPGKISADDVFTVKVEGRKAVQCRAGTPLLRSLEEGGVFVTSVCRSGECSMCRVKILRGKVYQTSDALVRKSDRRFGYVHSCVSYPLEDLEITF